MDGVKQCPVPPYVVVTCKRGGGWLPLPQAIYVGVLRARFLPKVVGVLSALVCVRVRVAVGVLDDLVRRCGAASRYNSNE